MYITNYKGILFIEENIDTNCNYEKSIDIKTKGLNNQLKGLDDLKEEIYQHIKKDNNKYNIVKSFSYGQKQNIMTFDDISFYGIGVLSFVEENVYNELLKKCSSKKGLDLVYSIKNEELAINKTVQINKMALYRVGKKTIGQIQLFNSSENQIHKVYLEVYSYNSFGVKKPNPKNIVLTRTINDSNEIFGDDEKIIFEENDVCSMSCVIKKVIMSENDEIDYNDAKYSHFDRTRKLLSQINLSEEEIESINEKFNLNISTDSVYPSFKNDLAIDFTGNIISTKTDPFNAFFSYIKSNQIKTDSLIIREKKTQEENQEKIKILKKEISKINIMFFMLLAIGIIAIGVFSYLSLSYKKFSNDYIDTCTVIYGATTCLHALLSIIISIIVLFKIKNKKLRYFVKYGITNLLLSIIFIASIFLGNKEILVFQIVLIVCQIITIIYSCRIKRNLKEVIKQGVLDDKKSVLLLIGLVIIPIISLGLFHIKENSQRIVQPQNSDVFVKEIEDNIISDKYSIEIGKICENKGMKSNNAENLYPFSEGIKKAYLKNGQTIVSTLTEYTNSYKSTNGNYKVDFWFDDYMLSLRVSFFEKNQNIEKDRGQLSVLITRFEDSNKDINYAQIDKLLSEESYSYITEIADYLGIDIKELFKQIVQNDTRISTNYPFFVNDAEENTDYISYDKTTFKYSYFY